MNSSKVEVELRELHRHGETPTSKGKEGEKKFIALLQSDTEDEEEGEEDDEEEEMFNVKEIGSDVERWLFKMNK